MLHTAIKPLTARRMPSQQTSLRTLLWEMNIGYQIQYRGDKSNEIGFACIATSYLRKDSAMERIRAFVDSHNLPYEVIDGSGLMFYVHDSIND